MRAYRPPAGIPSPGVAPFARSRAYPLAAAAILAAGTVGIYWASFSVPLLFDDQYAIAGNPTLRRLGSAFWPSANLPVSERPLLNVSFALNYALSRERVASYHAVNLAIHLLAGLALFAVVRRTLLRPVLTARVGASAVPLALAITALWLWHPLLTESVTYLSQRAESLMGLFYLLTLYCFIRGAEADSRDRTGWFALSVLACLAGVGTKEVIVTAPLLLFLYDRTFLAGGFSEAWRRRWPVYIALAATWLPLAFLMVRLHDLSVGFAKGISGWSYALTECRAVIGYLLLCFWPHPLVFDYGMGVVADLAEVWPYALALSVLLVLTAVALVRSPVAAFGACWFFLILAPTSSIVPVVGQPMAENRVYLPLAAVAASAVLAAYALAGRRVLRVFAVAAAVLGLASLERNRTYASAESLWADTVSKRPGNARAHYNLGLALSRIPGRRDDAIAQYRQAIRLQPDYAEAYNNLGLALSQVPGRLDDAVMQYRYALSIRPDSAEAHTNLGAAWSRIPGRQDDAMAEYREALRLDPGSPAAHNDLGLALSKRPGEMSDAVTQYREALRLDPDFVQAHNNLGVALAQTPGGLEDARSQFEEALRLDPDSTDAHTNLGHVFLETPGHLGDAVAQYTQALRLDPNLPRGWYHLGVCELRLGNLPAAADAFRNQLRVAPSDTASERALAEVLRREGANR